jgi:hypothetical protein
MDLDNLFYIYSLFFYRRALKFVVKETNAYALTKCSDDANSVSSTVRKHDTS